MLLCLTANRRFRLLEVFTITSRMRAMWYLQVGLFTTGPTYFGTVYQKSYVLKEPSFKAFDFEVTQILSRRFKSLIGAV